MGITQDLEAAGKKVFTLTPDRDMLRVLVKHKHPNKRWKLRKLSGELNFREKPEVGCSKTFSPL